MAFRHVAAPAARRRSRAAQTVVLSALVLSVPLASAGGSDPLDPDGLLADLERVHTAGPTGTFAAYILEAAVANGRDPHTWPSPGHPVRPTVALPTADGLMPMLRPAHALAKAGALAAGDIDRLRAHRDHSGYGDPDTFNDDLWALRTLAAAGATDSQDTEVAARIAALQQEDGGWGWRVGGASETDMTGVALETLTALDANLPPDARAAARTYLTTAARPDGGYPQRHGGPSNCNSTVWAMRGLAALGDAIPPAAWRHLEGLRTSGGVSYQAGQPALPLCTAEVATLVGDHGPSPRGRGAGSTMVFAFAALLGAATSAYRRLP